MEKVLYNWKTKPKHNLNSSRISSPRKGTRKQEDFWQHQRRIYQWCTKRKGNSETTTHCILRGKSEGLNATFQTQMDGEGVKNKQKISFKEHSRKNCKTGSLERKTDEIMKEIENLNRELYTFNGYIEDNGFKSFVHNLEIPRCRT